MSVDALNTTAEELPVHSTVERADRSELADALNDVLASTYVLYAKTHACHWNIAGPMFYSAHKLTDDQYNDLAKAVDDIAERVRALGFPALTGIGNYLQRSCVTDADEIAPALDMLRDLARDHATVASQIREAVKRAEGVDDVYTADLLTGRIGVHDEAAWMLNAMTATQD